MKTVSLILILLASFQLNGQEKWTCYTDDKAMVMDALNTLGVFNYVDGSLWFVTNKGINIFKDGDWKIINKKTELLKKKIGSYLVDSKNRIWIGTGSPDIFFDGYLPGQLYQGGVVIYDGNEWKPMNTKEMGIKAPVITEMFEASNGDIWLGVSMVRPGAEKGALFARGALLRYSNEEWTVYQQKDVPCLDCHFVKKFYEDDNGRLFFIAENGLYYFENDAFHWVKRADGFDLRTTPTATFIDSKNNLWLAAPTRVATYNGKEWRSFNRKNGLPSMEGWPYGFTETSDNKIILTAANGMYTYDNNDQWEQEKIKFLYGNSYVDKQDRLWIPALKGLVIRDGENDTMHKDVPKVWQIIEDHDGGIWAFSRNKGVKRFKDGEWQLFNDDNKLPSNKIAFTHISDNGTVWIATNKGICSCEYD